MHLVFGLLAATLTAAPAPTGVEWQLVDVLAKRTWTVPDSPANLLRGGRLEAGPDGAGLRLVVEHRPPSVTVRVTDTSGRDRGLVVRCNLSLTPGTWRWWQDLDTAQPLGAETVANTAGLRELPGLPEFGESGRPDYGRYSVYPAGAVQSAEGWLGLARPLEQLALVRFQATGGPLPRLSAEVDLALSSLSRAGREAAFTLHWLQGTSPRGLRAALGQELGLAKPELRVKRFGAWMPFWDLAKLPNVDEFNFAYQEGAPNPSFDDALGADSFSYFHCAGEFANVPGYTRGSNVLPAYDDLRKAFNDVAERHSGVPNVWDVCGVRGPDGKIAFLKEGVYGDFFCQGCVDPALPYGRAMADKLTSNVLKTPAPKGVDGCYYDGLAAGLDYADEHLKVAQHLLLWDGKLQRPVNYNLFSSAAWAKAIWDKFAGTGKLTMLNDSSLVSFTFVGPWIDVPGAEMGINLTRAQARLIRSTVGRKPFCTLVKADFRQVTPAMMETYFRRCTAYGILSGFFDISPSGANPGSSYWEHPEWYNRDRALFRRYLPLQRELAAAGWQPDPLASAASASVERFGPAGGLTYLTVSTDPGETKPKPRPITVSLDPELVKPGQVAVELLTGRVLPISPALTVNLTGEDLAVLALGSPADQAAACAARSADVLDRLSGYLNASSAVNRGLTPWSPYGEQGARLDEPGHDSAHAVRVERPEAKGMAGAMQSVALNQQAPTPLVISGWSKAENVTGVEDNGYALFVDCYYADGKALYGQFAPFKPGTHGWQRAEVRIVPDKPIRTASVYLMFRGNHTGTVWFDDVTLTAEGAPQQNLLPRGDLEGDATRPLVAHPAEAAALVAEWRRHAPETGFWGAEAAKVAAGPWGDDAPRLQRDLDDLRWQARLAAAAARPGEPLRASRLTDMVSRGAAPAPRPAGAAAQYQARTGKVPAGTEVIVDGNFDGYTPRALTDGRVNPEQADWADQAWASPEGGSHWIELRFAKPTPVKQLRLYWAKDAGTLRISRQIEVQTLVGKAWKPLAGQRVHPAVKGMTVIDLPGEALPALRIYQPADGGSPERPGLMWVSEVEVETGR